MSAWAAFIPDSAVLDPLAGSGALGLEALSRGARKVVLCDCSPQAARAVRRSLQILNDPHASFFPYKFPQDFDRLLPQGPFDLLFLDPPYQEMELAVQFLLKAARSGLVRNGARAFWEQDSRSFKDWDPEDLRPWTLDRCRRWGRRGAAFLTLGEIENEGTRLLGAQEPIPAGP
jgi:16S rRNA (guanine966-N2)-methyltransferase